MKQKDKLAGDQTKKLTPEIPGNDDLFAKAKWFEKQNKLSEASILYRKLIKVKRLNETYYNRLMMIYRKQKKYSEELKLINAGIKAFQDHYMPSATGKHHTIISLSKKLNVLIGLTDKKGRSLADRQPIARWKKRKAVLLKKMDALK